MKMIISAFDRVENIVGKGEIACTSKYKQFLLFPQCFQKASFSDLSKCVIVWEWVNSLSNDKSLDWSKIERICRQQNKYNLTTDVLFGMGRKHCGKRRKCWLPAFSPFLIMFLKPYFFRFITIVAIMSGKELNFINPLR